MADVILRPSLHPISAGIAPGKNGNDSYTKLLLHFDGADGSTTITDSSASAHTCTAVGNAQIDTAQSKFGGASLLLDGTGDRVSITDSAEFDLGVSGDPFTIDGWLRRNGDTAWAMFSRGGGGGGAGWNTTDGHMYMILSTGGTTYAMWNESGTATFISTATPPADTTQVHIAWTYDGTNMRFFFDGIQVGSTVASSGITAPLTRNITRVGDDPLGGLPLNGHVDELRVSKGIARWTSNFAVPTAAYG